MKIYSYLDAGRPLVATRLATHTQVLNDAVALLAEPTPEAMANALIRLLEDKSLADRLARNARQLARRRYSREAFENSVNHLYEHVSGLV